MIKPEEKNCGTSCGCGPAENAKTDGKEKLVEKTVVENAVEQVKLDPTHFGDWQVNCRAIDF